MGQEKDRYARLRKEARVNPTLVGIGLGGAGGAYLGQKKRKGVGNKLRGALAGGLIGAGIGGAAGTAADIAHLYKNRKRYYKAYKAGKKTPYNDFFKDWDKAKRQAQQEYDPGGWSHYDPKDGSWSYHRGAYRHPGGSGGSRREAPDPKPTRTNWRDGFKAHGVDRDSIKTKSDWKKVKRKTQFKYHPDRYSQKPKAEQDAAAEKFKDFMQHATSFENSGSFPKMASLLFRPRMDREKTLKAIRNSRNLETYQAASDHMYGVAPSVITGLGLLAGATLFGRHLRPLIKNRSMTSAIMAPAAALGAGFTAATLDYKLQQNKRGKKVFKKILEDKKLSKRDTAFLHDSLNAAYQDTKNPWGNIAMGSIGGGMAAAGAVDSRMPWFGTMGPETLASAGLSYAEMIRSGLHGLSHHKRYRKLIDDTKYKK